jgi:hypothetical protein
MNQLATGKALRLGAVIVAIPLTAQAEAVFMATTNAA